MQISVIICTYNRCNSLRRALATLTEMRVPENVSWELLLMDNRSSDDTKKVFHEFEARLPIRYIFEGQQGKSFALNSAVAHARGSLLLFTDDDVDVDPGWIAAYWDAAKRHPDASFFGGPFLARWEGTPPGWLLENKKWLHIAGEIDRGPQEQIVQNGDHPFFLGANMACRKEIKGLCFTEKLGPKGSDSSQDGNVRGEEIELQGRLLADGQKGVYVPAAVIHHRHSSHRLTEGYLRRWYCGHGIAEVRSGHIPQINLWWGAPRYFWKQFIVSGATYLLTRWTCKSRTWLKAETKFAFAWGIIGESRKQHARPRKETLPPAELPPK